MAAKKFYAVKRGKSTGIFSAWEECRTAVEGYSGAEYKGFATRQEAESYLGLVQEATSGQAETVKKQGAQSAGSLLTYVDGSYDDSLKKYAFGCVFLLEDGTIYTEYGNCDNPQS